MVRSGGAKPVTVRQDQLNYVTLIKKIKIKLDYKHVHRFSICPCESHDIPGFHYKPCKEELYPRGQGLSQFLQNEPAGSITTSQGTRKVRCYPSLGRMKQLGVLLLHRANMRSRVIPVFVQLSTNKLWYFTESNP